MLGQSDKSVPGRRRRPPAIASLALVATVGFIWLAHSGFVAAAQPAVRYATPAGLGQAPCAATSPCRLSAAVAASQPGDEIVLEPGRYGLGSTLTLSKDVYLHGAPGPLGGVQVRYGGTGPGITVNSPGAVLSDLTIEALGSSSVALELDAGTVERVRAASIATASAAVVLTGGLLRDSLIMADGSGAAGISCTATAASLQLAPQVSGVTVEATGAGSLGAVAQADSGGNATMTVTNSIVHGTASDLSAQGNTAKSSLATFVLSHDDFVSENKGSGSVFTDDGTSISPAPVFLNAAGHDFREAANSPTVDTGTLPPKPTIEEDLDDGPRIVGTAPDIGAFEHGGPPEIQLEQLGSRGFGAEDVSAAIIPGASTTTYQVEFGPTVAYGKLTGGRSAGSGDAPVLTPVTISGLLPGTVYHYRYIATSAAGISASPDGVFATRSPGPALGYTGAAKPGRNGTIQLHGSANPDGAAATAQFQWGRSSKYGRSSKVTAIGSGGTDIAVGATVKGLAAGHTYHYRLIAVNRHGTDAGVDAKFSLAAPFKAVIRTSHARVIRRTVVVLVACVGPAGARCRGTFTISYHRRAIASAHFNIKAGKTARLHVSLHPPAGLSLKHPLSTTAGVIVSGSRPGRATKLTLTA